MQSTLQSETKSTITLGFTGKGSELFSIQIVNFFLTLVTLGLYYPWAKAKTLQYLYRKTFLADSPFTFHGTGKEMFIGFIKGVGIFIALYGLLFWASLTKDPIIIISCVLGFLAGLALLVPIAIHGMMRYRTSRTSWRGIHFGYRGTAAGMVKLYLLNLFLTIITMGIYSSWFTVNVRREILENTRFGNAEFRYTGEGSDLFLIHVKGFFLTFMTLGIYMFWYAKELLKFYTDNIVVVQEDRYSRLFCNITGWDYTKLAVGNLLLVIFTLGLATPWATTRTMSLILGNSTLYGNFDPDSLVQTEENYTDAVYDNIADVMDIGLV